MTNIIEHTKQEHGKAKVLNRVKTIPCKLCRRKFATNSGLKLHIHKKHKKDDAFSSLAFYARLKPSSSADITELIEKMEVQQYRN